jgi:hypothetical protein
MKENFYLVKYKDNWADEINIDGHIVLTKEIFKKFDAIAKKNLCFTMCIGTNEEIEYNNNDWQKASNAYSVVEITGEQYNVLKELDMLKTRFAEKFVDHILYLEDCYDDEEENDVEADLCEDCGECVDECVC